MPYVILYQLFAKLRPDEVTFQKKRENFFSPDVLKRQSVQALFKKNLKKLSKNVDSLFFQSYKFLKITRLRWIVTQRVFGLKIRYAP